MDLQSQPHLQPVFKDPFGQLPGIEAAVGSVARRSRMFGERRRKNHAAGLPMQLMGAGEVAREFIVLATSQDKLDFVLRRKCREIAFAKRSAFAGTGAFYV